MNDKTTKLQKMQGQLNKWYIELDRLKTKAELEMIELGLYEGDAMAQNYYNELIEELQAIQDAVEQYITYPRRTGNNALTELESEHQEDKGKTRQSLSLVFNSTY